ncbi:MAG: serpin family protein [Lachnospiraceae bacterium]|nr:serpin family protein [Lachnospiraceae bacterium]
MKGEDIYSAMDGIKDDILVRSEKNKGCLKKKKWIWPAVAGLVVVVIIGIVMLIQGSNRISASNLMKGISPNEDIETVSSNEYAPVITDFAVRLLKESFTEEENQLLSPASVILALGMTANGANGETLRQMETVLGAPVDTLNRYLYSYADNLGEDSVNYKVSIANSIWYNENLKNVAKDFLQKNADYYNADLYQRKFDNGAIEEINKWAKNKTEGMIPEILDDISQDNMMYLINALCFDAEWVNMYHDIDVREGDFTKEDGKKQKTKFMCSIEYQFIEDDYATGFIKPYKWGKYAFVALLPNQGVSIADYIKSLDAGRLTEMITNASHEYEVSAKLPKFSLDYSISLEDVLKKMGIRDAFEPNYADFSNMAAPLDEPLYISDVLQKTFIQVDEKGTKAGAVTKVEVTAGRFFRDVKDVFLDRPFIYMIIDTDSNVPFFIGTMMEIPQE